MESDDDFQWDEPATREAVKGRSGSVCEACLAARATDMHHRITRGTRGKWTPANILHLCRRCHSWVTINPLAAQKRGLSLPSSDDPNEHPFVRDTGEAVYVSDDVTPPALKRHPS